MAAGLRSAIVWDFDFSLIPVNSDTHIPRALAPSPPLEALLATRGVPWTELMGRVLDHLHASAVPPSAISAAAAAMPFDPSIHEAIRSAHGKGVRQFILSDANTLYIGAFLEAHALTRLFTAVHTNPATLPAAGDGPVRLAPAHSGQSPHGCPMCPPNLCKGGVLSAWQQGGELSSATRVFYVGDGMGDACPALRLGQDDVVLARAGFPLARALGEGGALAASLRARLVQWGTGEELRDALQAALGEGCSH